MEKSMKLALIFVSLFCFLQNTMAANNDAQDDAQDEALLKSQIEKAEAGRKKNEAGLKEWTKRLEFFKKQIDNCKSSPDMKAQCEATDGLSEKALQKEAKKADEQIVIWGEDLDKAKTSLLDLDKIKAKKYQEKVQDIDNAYAAVGRQQTNAKFELVNLGRDIDKIDMGKYVAAKIGLMLNSQAFCDSTVRCQEPKGQAKRKVTPEQLQKEIFTGLDADVFKGTDFWQKAQENRNGGSAPATSTAPAAPAANPAKQAAPPPGAAK